MKPRHELPSWQLQDAKARFSELVDTALEQGPQLVTRRGVDAVVVVPAVDWKRMQQSSRPTLKQLLLGGGLRFELELPPRGRSRRRAGGELG